MRTRIFSACLAAAIFAPTTLLAESAGDQEMAQYIGSQLKESGQLHSYRIGVKYQDGVAWLNGTVANEQQMSTAMRLARQIRGVDHVVDNLSVNDPSPDSGNRFLELGRSLKQAGAGGEQKQQQQQARADIGPSQPRTTYLSNRLAKRQAASQRPVRTASHNNMPLPIGAMPVRQAAGQSYGPRRGPMPAHYAANAMGRGPMPAQYSANATAPMMGQGAMPAGYVPGGQARAVNYDNAQMPGYSWPSYASYPNYAALTYPQQYSPTAWPYIGPFYPYPQVPLGWRKVALEWDDGWWFLDFSDVGSNH